MSLQHSKKDKGAQDWMSLCAGGASPLTYAQCVHQLVKHMDRNSSGILISVPLTPVWLGYEL